MSTSQSAISTAASGHDTAFAARTPGVAMMMPPITSEGDEQHGRDEQVDDELPADAVGDDAVRDEHPDGKDHGEREDRTIDDAADDHPPRLVSSDDRTPNAR